MSRWMTGGRFRTKDGHYAFGRCEDGHEINIYRAGAYLCNVTTGETITDLVSWRPAQIRDRKPYIL